jgi:hypothetical protein
MTVDSSLNRTDGAANTIALGSRYSVKDLLKLTTTAWCGLRARQRAALPACRFYAAKLRTHAYTVARQAPHLQLSYLDAPTTEAGDAKHMSQQLSPASPPKVNASPA